MGVEGRRLILLAFMAIRGFHLCSANRTAAILALRRETGPGVPRCHSEMCTRRDHSNHLEGTAYERCWYVTRSMSRGKPNPASLRKYFSPQEARDRARDEWTRRSSKVVFSRVAWNTQGADHDGARQSLWMPHLAMLEHKQTRQKPKSSRI